MTNNLGTQMPSGGIHPSICNKMSLGIWYCINLSECEGKINTVVISNRYPTLAIIGRYSEHLFEAKGLSLCVRGHKMLERA
jgi:hypothetical protein